MKLKIAVQKSGRLSEDSLQLIKNCGISFPKVKNRLKAQAFNFPIELLYLRDDDIPQYVADGVADIGIVGENELLEKNKKVDVLEKLGFSKCRFSIAVPRDTKYKGIEQLDGKSIATSYPFLLEQYLTEKGIKAKIHEISGSVEIAPSIGLADAVADLVSSGSTLLSNGLKEVEVVMRSQAVLIGSPNIKPKKLDILDRLQFRMQSVLRAKKFKYVLMNAPNSSIEAIKKVIPGMKSPTITPLAKEGWSSLHSVVNEEDFWEVIDELRNKGAQGILVVPIEKMIQ